jgi:hypothetical protein
MLNTIIPKTRYNTTDYPNMESEANRTDGAPIPVAIGDIHNIVPTCIDTVAQTFKVAGHAIDAVSAVRSGAETLVLTTDYTVDLANAQITITSTPKVVANTTYYVLFESDVAIDGANYYCFEENLGHYHPKVGAEFDGERFWTIDGADAWSDSGRGLYFDVMGKTSLDGDEEYLVQRYSKTNFIKTGHWDAGALFRQAAGNTKVAQQFTTPAAGGPWYITRIKVNMVAVGALATARITNVSILSAAKAQIGAKSIRYEEPTGAGAFPQRSEVTEIQADIQGAEKAGAMIDTVADALEYLVGTTLGKSATLLDAAGLAALSAARTQKVKLFLDEGQEFNQILGKMESGQLWKLIPLLDGTYQPTVYAAGEPANTPHFRDEDYLSFRMWQDYSAVRQTVRVKYDQDAGDQSLFKSESVTSDVARFFYLNEESLETETYLAAQAGATWLAGELSGMYEVPPLYAEFEVHGYGLDLIPGRDKVKLTRTRAMYAGGTLSAVLFRILKLQKKPGTSTTVILAQKDDQTY